MIEDAFSKAPYYMIMFDDQVELKVNGNKNWWIEIKSNNLIIESNTNAFQNNRECCTITIH